MPVAAASDGWLGASIQAATAIIPKAPTSAAASSAASNVRFGARGAIDADAGGGAGGSAFSLVTATQRRDP
jgi:hypothetical protein